MLVDLYMKKQCRKFSVAPMLGITDRHCLFFYSLLSPNVNLYSEMIVTSALINNVENLHKYLYFNHIKNHTVLQLGGNIPIDLARCASFGEFFGYKEININCGCPSDRVLKGSFGASLMNKPLLVADCIKAIQDTVSIPVSVKHRLGLNDNVSYGFLRDFVGIIYDVGCRVFVVHARNAILGKLNPKNNRTIPALNYEYVYQLKKDFPDAVIILNGGILTLEIANSVLQKVDGIMIGRAVMNNPLIISSISSVLWPDYIPYKVDRIINIMIEYAEKEVSNGVPIGSIVRPMLNMFKGFKGAKIWRNMLSDQSKLKKNNPEIIMSAWKNISVFLNDNIV
ncbi:MAG: tRNA dihydrouridine(20/20a) synthase DusA [Candidatus Kinetoplastibacterium crithidii]|nr:MAG: tRNA dihydrouridine(20/20a) synthase DusA [Candidatus Kinetoplastibacterium crithidii]